MKTKQKYLLLIVFVPMIFPGCLNTSGNTISFDWPKSLPESQIIFQSTMHSPFEFILIDPDGSNEQILNLPNDFIKAVWSNDRKHIYGLSNPEGMYPYENIGYPSYWNIDEGNFSRCLIRLPYYSQIEQFTKINNRNIVILQNLEQIILFDMQTCREIYRFVDYSNQIGKFGIIGFSFFAKTDELFFGEYTVPYPHKYRIIKLNLTTKERVKLAEGINPTISPDGMHIAYIGIDGLYIMNNNGRNEIQLVNIHFFDSKNAASPSADVTIPRWSPDGAWLVYHQCADMVCRVKEASINKTRVSDGYTEKLFMGGEYPSWRP